MHVDLALKQYRFSVLPLVDNLCYYSWLLLPIRVLQFMITTWNQRFWNSGTGRTWRESVQQICQIARPNVRDTFADLSLCFICGPADFHSVWLYSNSSGPNVRHGFRSFQNLWHVIIVNVSFIFGPADFHSVWLYSNSSGPNVRHGFRSFQNLWHVIIVNVS